MFLSARLLCSPITHISVADFVLVWSYLTIYYLLEDVFKAVILWRGHSKISIPIPHLSTHAMIKWVDFDFPLHSMVLFICSVSIVEYPDLLPSFFFLTIGWYVVIWFPIDLFMLHFLQLTLILFQLAICIGSCLLLQKGGHPIQIHGRTAKLFRILHRL